MSLTASSTDAPEHRSAPARWSSLLLLCLSAPLAGCGAGADVPREQAGETETALVCASSWTATPPLEQMRYSHTSTLLSDGRVLIAGGMIDLGDNGYVDFTSSEVFDPAVGAWSSAGPMSVGVVAHAATRLANGHVLVTGGWDWDTSAAVNAAQEYDPATDVWTPVASMAGARSGLSSVLMPDGRVLVAGGYPSYLGAEIYNPSTGLWTTVASLSVPRFAAQGFLLASGHVLVLSDNTGERFDPASGTWTPIAPMPAAAVTYVATQLADGRVLATRGAVSQIYDPVADLWTPAAPMIVPRVGHTSVLSSCGLVVATGGLGPLDTAEVYDPATNTWTMLATMTEGRFSHAMSALPDGRVLVSGGQRFDPLFLGDGLATAEVIDVCCPLPDMDGDGVTDALDNCPSLWNPSQSDTNTNGIGDACEMTCATFQRGAGKPASACEDATIAVDPAVPTTAGTNYGLDTDLLTGTLGSATRRALLKVDLTSLPATAVISSAVLRMRKAQSPGQGVVNVHRITAPWVETSVTWSSFAGAFDASIAGSVATALVPNGGYADVDITALVQTWASGASPNHGVLLDEPGPARAIFGSSNAPLLSRPQLNVCYMPGE